MIQSWQWIMNIINQFKKNCRQLSERAGGAGTLDTYPFPVGLLDKLSGWVCESIVRYIVLSIFKSHSPFADMIIPAVWKCFAPVSLHRWRYWPFCLAILLPMKTYLKLYPYHHWLFSVCIPFLLPCPSLRTLCSGEGCTADSKSEPSRENLS